MKEMLTVKSQIAARARKYREEGLTNLHGFISESYLKAVYYSQNRQSAAGTDGQSWGDYGVGLEENLKELLSHFKQGSYWAPHVKRLYIPKGRNEKRALGLPTIADKVLQGAVSGVLSAVYEEEFYNFSYGFRPKRSTHDAMERLQSAVHDQHLCYIIDADIKDYFGSLNHAHLRDLLTRRIKDGVILRTIHKWLKAGVLEGERVSYPSKGSPQGGSISPLLANVYLHYVLDEWFMEEIHPDLKEECELIRYADDFVICCKSRSCAEELLGRLKVRLREYELELHPEKTRLIDLSKSSHGGRGFDFLGFRHYMGQSRKGRPVLKRKTQKSRLNRSIVKLDHWIRDHRHLSVKELIAKLNVKLNGHYQHYGVTHNYDSLNRTYRSAYKSLYKWLNRRGGKAKWTWLKLNQLLGEWNILVRPKIHRSYVKAKP